MPNYCDYIMKVKGTADNCRAFLKKLNDYDEPNHFWRIFEAYDDDEYDMNDGNHVMEISGYCAWSIESCCRASGYSGGTDLLSVNTKDLDLEVEIYTEEPGMCFQEHYIYKKGSCLVDECVGIDLDDNMEVIGGFGNDYGRWKI